MSVLANGRHSTNKCTRNILPATQCFDDHNSVFYSKSVCKTPLPISI